MTPCNGEALFFPSARQDWFEEMEHPSIVKPLKIKEGTDVVTKERACRHKQEDQSHDPQPANKKQDFTTPLSRFQPGCCRSKNFCSRSCQTNLRILQSQMGDKRSCILQIHSGR